jgi:CheY-like chemotaxis protein
MRRRRRDADDLGTIVRRDLSGSCRVADGPCRHGEENARRANAVPLCVVRQAPHETRLPLQHAPLASHGCRHPGSPLSVARSRPCLGARVLIVDDDDAVRSLLSLVLEDAGCVVIGEASDGASGVRLAEQLRPDLITMDVHMPLLDGLAATRRIAALGIAPVIVVSASPTIDCVAAALAAGASCHISKRDAVSELPLAVDVVLGVEELRDHEPNPMRSAE